MVLIRKLVIVCMWWSNNLSARAHNFHINLFSFHFCVVNIIFFLCTCNSYNIYCAANVYTQDYIWFNLILYIQQSICGFFQHLVFFFFVTYRWWAHQASGQLGKSTTCWPFSHATASMEYKWGKPRHKSIYNKKICTHIYAHKIAFAAKC